MPSIFGNSAFSGLNQLSTSALSNTQPQVGFDGPVASTSISIVPTIVVDEVNSMEADDWQKDAAEEGATEEDVTEEDATHPQQVSLPTPFKPTSNGWPLSSFALQLSTPTTLARTTPVLTTLPVTTPDILEIVAPNVTGMPSMSRSSALTQKQLKLMERNEYQSTTAFISGEGNSPHTQRK